jgi:hypothetical protein
VQDRRFLPREPIAPPHRTASAPALATLKLSPNGFRLRRALYRDLPAIISLMVAEDRRTMQLTFIPGLARRGRYGCRSRRSVWPTPLRETASAQQCSNRRSRRVDDWERAGSASAPMPRASMRIALYPTHVGFKCDGRGRADGRPEGSPTRRGGWRHDR